jgi:hypothetical protein
MTSGIHSFVDSEFVQPAIHAGAVGLEEMSCALGVCYDGVVSLAK